MIMIIKIGARFALQFVLTAPYGPDYPKPEKRIAPEFK